MTGRAALAVLVAALGVGAPVAHAADTGVFTCRTVLNLAAGGGMVHCVGSATGEIDGAVGTFSLDAGVNYAELLCPVLATAIGAVNVGGTNFAEIEYTRVGSHFTALLSGKRTGIAQGEMFVDAVDIGLGLCSDTNVGVELVGTFVARRFN